LDLSAQIDCSYFTGVISILEALGVFNNRTRVAGASGGAITSAAVCGGLSGQQQFSTQLDLAASCRPDACRGNLNDAVKKSLQQALPTDVDNRCSGRLSVAGETKYGWLMSCHSHIYSVLLRMLFDKFMMSLACIIVIISA
jgi:hypothetical protein